MHAIYICHSFCLISTEKEDLRTVSLIEALGNHQKQAIFRGCSVADRLV